jgi:hypothetical protein
MEDIAQQPFWAFGAIRGFRIVDVAPACDVAFPSRGVRTQPTLLRIVEPLCYRVARAGIEPATFRFSGGRSYRLSYLAKAGGQMTASPFGDPDGTRTRDLRRDRAAR